MTDSFLEPAWKAFSGTSDYSGFKSSIEMLIKTKQTVYGYDHRHIMSFDLSYNGEGEYYLQVLSSFALPDSPEFTVNQIP